jgi:membrane-associated phospholipid phosphatase
LRITTLPLCFVALLLARPALAETALDPTPGNRSPVEVDLAIDIPLTITPFVAVGVPYLLADEILRPACLPDCSPDNINSFDRYAVGKLNMDADIASDVLFATNLALPHVLGLIDQLVSEPEDGWIGYAKDEMVLIQTTGISLALNALVGMIVRRPRPLVYDENAPEHLRTGGTSSLSYFSGHVAVSMAVLTSYNTIFTMRHPDSDLLVPLWVTTYLSVGAVAWLRVESGNHFPTDVIVASVSGATVGFLVPYLHFVDEEERDAPSVSIVPTGFPGGVGAMLTLH